MKMVKTFTSFFKNNLLFTAFQQDQIKNFKIMKKKLSKMIEIFMKIKNVFCKSLT